MDEEKKCSCVLCGAKLDSKEKLQEHFRKHANKEIDAKGNPIKPLPKKDAIDKELDKLRKTNKITCDVCPMEFETVTLAIQHKFRKHPESAVKYYCPFCGMQFPIKFTRDKHVETHNNMSTFGSFPCSECGEVFHNSQAQNYHYKSTHKRIMSIFKPVPTPPPSKKIKINNANEAQSVYYCYLCGMEYIIKFNLQKHLERSHTEEERNKVPDDLIKCTTCDALFYNKKAYENHNMYHRPDDLYVTSEEQRLQTVTRVDQDFDIRRVQPVTDKYIPVDKPKSRRQNIKKIQVKKEKIMKPPTDDELSPTSSIESSDSESECNSELEKKSKQKIVSATTSEKIIKQENIPNIKVEVIFNKQITPQNIKTNDLINPKTNESAQKTVQLFKQENTDEETNVNILEPQIKIKESPITNVKVEVIFNEQITPQNIKTNDSINPKTNESAQQSVELFKQENTDEETNINILEPQIEIKESPVKNVKISTKSRKRQLKSPKTCAQKRSLRSNTTITSEDSSK